MTDLLDLPSETREPVETAEDNGHRDVREPLVYQLREQRSWFKDRWLSQTDKEDARLAGERLERHQRQMAAVSKPETRTFPGTTFEYRVTPNLELGHGGEFAPPLWLNQYFATARRPEQVIQRLVEEHGNEFDLPPGCSSVNVPRMTTGTLVNDQTPNAPTDNVDVETATVKAQALYYSGESDWSLQALEQSPPGAYLDRLVFKDAMESLDAELEKDFVVGKGETVNEALGLLNITGIATISCTEIKTEAMFTACAEAMAAVGVERERPIDAWLMGSARLAFLAFAVEKEQRPMVLTDNVGDTFPVASMGGVAIYFDEGIPRTVNVNQEPILAVRAEDFLLWHSPVTTAVYEDVLAGTLGVRFLLRRTTASMLHRYPSGIAAITGAGMKAKEKYFS